MRLLGCRCRRERDQQREHDRVAGKRCRDVGRDEERDAGHHHRSRPPAVSDGTGHRLSDAPHELRDAEGKADRCVADAGVRIERADEEWLRLAQAEPEREYRTGGERDRERMAVV